MLGVVVFVLARSLKGLRLESTVSFSSKVSRSSTRKHLGLAASRNVSI